MKNLKNVLPSILFILFELAFGILLIMSPKQLTKTVLICFGIVLLILGFIYLIRYIKEKKEPEKSSYLTLPFAIASFAAALFCIIYGLLAAAPETFATIIYGAVFIVLGVYKAKTYNDNRKEGVPASAISLVSGILSVAFGVAIIFLKSMNASLLLTLAGCAMILEAVLDAIAVAFSMSKKPEVIPLPAKPGQEALPASEEENADAE